MTLQTINPARCAVTLNPARCAVIALLFALTSPLARATHYEVDASHSTMGFKISHLSISEVQGSFTDFTGSVTTSKPGDFATATLTFTAKASSINTGNGKRDEHLKSDDFFAAAKYPEAKFVGQKVEAKGKDTFTLSGDLTLRGVTLPVTFEVEAKGKVVDPWGNTRYGFTARSKVSRKAFGIAWNKQNETGTALVGDDVKLEIGIELIEKKSPNGK